MISDGKSYKTRILCADIIMHVIMSDTDSITAAIRSYDNIDPLVTSLMTDSNNYKLNGAITTVLASLITFKPSLMDKVKNVYDYQTLLKLIKQLFVSAKANNAVLKDETGISGYILLIPLYPKTSNFEKSENELFLNIMSLLQSDDIRTLKGVLTFAYDYIRDIGSQSLLQQYGKLNWITACYDRVKCQEPSLYQYIKNIFEEIYVKLLETKTNYLYNVITDEQITNLCGINDSYMLSLLYHTLTKRYSMAFQIESSLLQTPFVQGRFYVEESKLLGKNKTFCIGFISQKMLYIYQEENRTIPTLLYCINLHNCTIVKKASDGYYDDYHVTITAPDESKTSVTIAIQDKQAIDQWYNALNDTIKGTTDFVRHESIIESSAIENTPRVGTPKGLTTPKSSMNTPMSTSKKTFGASKEPGKVKPCNYVNFYYSPLFLSAENITQLLSHMIDQLPQLVDIRIYIYLIIYLFI